MKTKLVAIILVAAMLAAIFAGCAAQGSPADPTQSGTEKTVEATEGSAEPVTLTALIGHVTDESLFPFPVLEQIAQKANVKIDWQVIANPDWNQQKAVFLASGELPDLVIACQMTDNDVNGGAFIDLAPYIDQMPNVKEFLDSVPEAASIARNLEGQIYGLPSKPAYRPYSGDVFYVNQTWLDKLGMEVPTTTDEFMEMLIRFRDEDPNGNGIQDEIGITGYGGGQAVTDHLTLNGLLGWCFPAFGCCFNMNTYYCMVQDGAPVFLPTTDKYRAACEYLAKMWSENLLDHEYFSLGFPEQAAKYRSDPLTVGAGVGWTKETNAGENADNYTYIAPLTGPFGDQYWNSAAGTNTMYANRAAISTNCKNVDAALRFINELYDQYNSLQLCYGSEGVTFEMGEDGYPVFKETPEGYTDDEWAMNNGIGIGAPGWVSDEYNQKIGGQNNAMVKYELDDFYAPYFNVESRMPVLKFSQADMEEMAILQTDVKNFILQSLTDFIINGVTDESWTEYVNTLERMDLARYMELITNAYHAAVG